LSPQSFRFFKKEPVKLVAIGLRFKKFNFASFAKLFTYCTEDMELIKNTLL